MANTLAAVPTGSATSPCCCGSCPGTDKMLLPFLTESSGTWYADCASASSVLTNPLAVSNCIGYCGGGPGQTSFTATDSGTSITFDVGGVSGAATSASLNLQSGKTITVTCSPGAAVLLVNIYDNTGTLVEYSGVATTPWTSAALPYTGRYIISVNVAGLGPVSTSSTVTTTGTYSVNQIQALYDTGGASPSCLNCGSSC